MEDKYPGPRTFGETTRLRAQHDLVVSALGGLVLCPVDLNAENLHILDSGTADGYYLYALRQQLKHPESATLIGTDIANYPDTLQDLPPGTIQLQKQNFMKPWPCEWEGKFDLVQQRACMANAPNHEQAVDVVRRLVKLVKPGGWIQLVDGQMPTDAISDNDPPSEKVWKTVGILLSQCGLDPMAGTRLKEYLVDAGGVQHIDSQKGISILGKGCAPGLEEDSYIQLRGFRENIGNALKAMKDPPVTFDFFDEAILATMEEARTKGVEMKWYGAWAQRVA